MALMIRFELRKILGNRVGMAACILALAMLVALSVMNLTTAAMRDFDTGEVVEGVAAQQALRATLESHAGVLDDAHVLADAQTLDRANELAQGIEGLSGLSNSQIIEEYGLELWQQTRAVMEQRYYAEVVGTLDSVNPRATSLQEGAETRIDTALTTSDTFYSDAERDYWKEKASAISWPLEFGYATGWNNVLDYISFSGFAIVALCIALSRVFAGEYQTRAVAVVLPTRRGKRALPVAKALAVLIFTTVYWWICALAVIGINLAVCGADGWGLPVQVVYGFDNPYPLTIGQVVVALYVLGYLISLGMAALTLLISAKLRSAMPAAVIPMAIVLLGMAALFFNPLVRIGLLTPLSGLNYAFQRMVSYAAGPVVVDLPTVLAVIYAVMVAVFTPLALRTFSTKGAS